MKKKRLLTTLLTMAAVLYISCTAAFASQAVVDDYTYQYQHQSRFDDAIVIDGIDVSYYQQNVDWDAVKRHGIDYVFIRIGTTATDQFKIVKDSYFEEHYAGAKEAGLMVGVYYFSTAISKAEAEKEANNVKTWLNDRHLDLPVVLDYEFETDSHGDDYRNLAAYKTWPEDTRNSKSTSIATTFLNYITENTNYDAMFYSNRNIMDDNYADCVFNMKTIDQKYPVWIAQYSTDISYGRIFEFWQYADDGKVSGIDGPVDCNFWYFDADNYPAAEGKTAISKATAKLSTQNYTYDGYAKTPKVTLTYNGSTLTEGTHYTVSYIKNAKAGDAYALIKGMGKYDGYKMVKFGVKIPFTNCTVSDIGAVTYSGSAKKPTVKVYYNGSRLTEGKDYTVSYKNNIQAGVATATVTGKDQFRGTLSKTFTINKKDISKSTAKLSYTTASYSGKAKVPKVTIYGLEKNEDFTVSYKNNIKIGTATVTIKGINSCIGSQTKKFVIKLGTPKDVKVNLRASKTSGYNDVKVTWDKVTGASSYRVYYKKSSDDSYKYKKVSKGSTTSKILYGLKSGTKYNVKVIAYTSSGKKSSYSSVKSIYTLKKVTQYKVKKYSSTKVKISWANINGETGYQISRSTKKTGTNVVATVKSTTAKSKILTVPKKGKTYYYKVRAYKLVNGVKVCGPWSTVYSKKL